MKKQNGFSAVIVLLSILVVTAIGFTGYYVWNTQKEKKEQTNQADLGRTNESVSVAQTDLSENNSKTPQASADITYFKIPELGIKLVLAENIKDLTYESQGDNMIKLSTKELQNLDISCGPSGGPLGALMKENGVYTNSNSPGDLVKQFEGYYIIITPQQGCPNGFEDSVSKLFAVKDAALKQSLASVMQLQ